MYTLFSGTGYAIDQEVVFVSDVPAEFNGFFAIVSVILPPGPSSSLRIDASVGMLIHVDCFPQLQCYNALYVCVLYFLVDK